MTITQIYKQAKSLSPLEKVRLSDMLLNDLDKEDPDVTLAWVKEVKRRRQAIKTGKAKTLSFEQVMGKYK